MKLEISVIDKQYIFRTLTFLFVMFLVGVLGKIMENLGYTNVQQVCLVMMFLVMFQSFELLSEFIIVTSLIINEFWKIVIYAIVMLIFSILIMLGILRASTIYNGTYFSSYLVALINVVVLFFIVIRAMLIYSRLVTNYMSKVVVILFTYVRISLFSLVIIGMHYAQKLQFLESDDYFIITCKLLTNGFKAISGNLLDEYPTSISFLLLFSIGGLIMTLISNNIISDNKKQEFAVYIKREDVK